MAVPLSNSLPLVWVWYRKARSENPSPRIPAVTRPNETMSRLRE